MKTTNLISAAFIGTTCTLSILGYSMSAKAADLKPVDIELVFLLDGSVSISKNDFNNQINALSKIFNSTNFYDVFVKPLPTKKLAVSAYQFGTQGTLDTPVISQLANWVLIDEQHQQGGTTFAQDLSDGINAQISNLSPIGDAVFFVTNALLNNGYDGHKVINISTDGLNERETISTSTAAEYAFHNKVTINGLVIPSIVSQTGGNTLDTPYNLSTITNLVETSPLIPAPYKSKNFDGSAAFIMTEYATGQMSLQDALLLKLGKETIGQTLFSSRPPLIFAGSGSPPSPGRNPPSPEASADQTIPEPNAILGLLSLGTLGLIQKIKRQ